MPVWRDNIIFTRTHTDSKTAKLHIKAGALPCERMNFKETADQFFFFFLMKQVCKAQENKVSAKPSHSSYFYGYCYHEERVK